MSDNGDGCLVLFAIPFILVGLYLLVVYLLPATIAVGLLFGGGVGINNYVRSFLWNVRPESDPNGQIAKCIMILVALLLIALVATIVNNYVVW